MQHNLKPIIYYLDDKISPDQSTIIPGILRYFEESSDDQISHQIIEKGENLSVVLTSGEHKIGLLSHESKLTTALELLKQLQNEGCNVMICTSLFKTNLHDSIAHLVSRSKFKSIYLKSFWSASLKVNQLQAYELDKLIDLIQTHFEIMHDVAAAPTSE